MEMGEKRLFQLSQQQLKRGKYISSKTGIFYIQTTTDKIELTVKV